VERVREIAKDLLKHVEEAEKAQATAKELFKLAREMGVDVSEQERRMRELAPRIEMMKKALKKRV